jgi:hypothetical protein
MTRLRIVLVVVSCCHDLSSAHRQGLTLFLIPLYLDQAPQRGGGITDDLARWGSCGSP